MAHVSKKELSPQTKSSHNFVQNCFYILFFVTPLLLWPYTSEVFEFNKMMFVYLMTTVITASWLLRSIEQKKFEIAKTPLDIPILLFLSSQIISTITSIDQHTSLWGYYSRFHGGLASTICYVLLFYAYVTHFSGYPQAIKKTFTAILASAVLISIYAILEKLGIDKHIWVQDVQNRVFSTLGQPNWLSAYLVALLPLSLFSILKTKDQNSKILQISLSLLYLTAIFFTKSQSGIGATAVVLTLFVIMISLQKRKPLLMVVLATLFLGGVLLKGSAIIGTLNSLNKINPFYSDTLTIITEENKTRIGGSDSMAIRRVVWEGAIELGKRYPFFGTGVETFGYSYYWVRPPEHNLTSEADFLYNKAHNEYLNFLATTGFVGLGAYLFLIGSMLFLYLKRKDSEYSSSLFLGFVSILITNYFGFSVVNIALFFFLYPAIFLASLDTKSKYEIVIRLNKTFANVVIFLIATVCLLGIRRMWVADVLYSAGRTNLEKNLSAIKLRPNEPLYHSQLGNIQALVAIQLIKPQIDDLPASTSAELKNQADSILNQYITDAHNNVSRAVQMNRYNLNLLKTKARTELTLSALDPKYNLEALQTLLKITELSPNEATNFYNVGVLYASIDKKDEAILAFNKAIELKSDYEAARARLEELR